MWLVKCNTVTNIKKNKNCQNEKLLDSVKLSLLKILW